MRAVVDHLVGAKTRTLHEQLPASPVVVRDVATQLPGGVAVELTRGSPGTPGQEDSGQK